ncbi:MAG: glycosyltransferase family 4 protein [Candidatus Chisholmbacteria bacterium]|nr:glycosyltransferase family 4 protein [Candidatus Chisholmbacteria bacterium]
MRIGIDITPIIYLGTGVGTYTKELARHLPLVAPHHSFVFFAGTLRGQKKLNDFLQTLAVHQNVTVKLYPLPPSLTEFAWNNLHLFSIERLVGPVDVFHAWDWQQPPAIKAKLVTTIHDLTPLKFPQDHLAKTVAVHRRRLHWVKKEAAAIIADSEATKKDVIELLKIPQEMIHPVYLAANETFTNFIKQPTKIITQEIDRVRSRYQLHHDYLLSVGTREPRKNLSRIVDAFKAVDERFHLVIAGNYGWGNDVDKPNVELTKRIHTLGFVPEQNLPALYAGAAALVYPSLYEGFGLPVLEAMSVGCPVVTSDRGSLKEVVSNTAVVVNPESQNSIYQGILEAISREKELKTLGFKRSHQFSWEKTARETLKVYELAARR